MLVVDSEPVFAAGAVGILGGAGFEAVALDPATSDPESGTWVTQVPALRPAAVVVDAGLGLRPYGR